MTELIFYDFISSKFLGIVSFQLKRNFHFFLPDVLRESKGQIVDRFRVEIPCMYVVVFFGCCHDDVFA